MKSLARSLLLLTTLAGLAPARLQAQGPSTFAVSRLSDLSFGTLIAGTSTTVAPTDATAGEFLITAPKRSLVTLTLSLPAALSGPAPLPIVFGPSSAAWASVNVPARGTFFDPHSGPQITMPSSRNLYVWLGGILTVAQSQAAGSYSGTVTLSVVLN